MSIPLLLWLLSTKLLLFLDVIYCAPKIGGIMFEPILFEAFESDEKMTIPTVLKETKLSDSTVDTTLLYAITRSSKETVAQVDTLRLDVEMEYPVEEPIITSTTTASVQKTTAFISELNIETMSTPINTTLTSNNSSADPSITFVTKQTTKKVMLYELLTPDKLKKYGRARDESDNVILNFLGYNFDDTICRIVDDRVLCGYNSNPQLAQPVQTVEVGNGCRLRGDRIECGYVNPPFDGMRRPAVRPGGNSRHFSQESLSDRQTKQTTKESLKLTISYSKTKPTTTTTTSTAETTTTKAASRVQTIATNPSTTIVSPSTTTVTKTERTPIKNQEHCVEKGDRIVCYDVKN